jgi:hypothetical protein
MAKKRTPPKKPNATATKGLPKTAAESRTTPSQGEFDEILRLIDSANSAEKALSHA